WVSLGARPGFCVGGASLTSDSSNGELVGSCGGLLLPDLPLVPESGPSSASRSISSVTRASSLGRLPPGLECSRRTSLSLPGLGGGERSFLLLPGPLLLPALLCGRSWPISTWSLSSRLRLKSKTSSAGLGGGPFLGVGELPFLGGGTSPSFSSGS